MGQFQGGEKRQDVPMSSNLSHETSDTSNSMPDYILLDSWPRMEGRLIMP